MTNPSLMGKLADPHSGKSRVLEQSLLRSVKAHTRRSHERQRLFAAGFRGVQENSQEGDGQLE